MYRQQQHIVTGMNKDTSPDKLKNTYVFDARNIRITARDDNSTLMTVTNEKGPAFKYTIIGKVVGSATFTNALVLFTHHDVDGDRIYVLKLSNSSNGEETSDLFIRFIGDLGLSTYHPLETLAFYESPVIQKVYFTDGIHQPRVINIYDADGRITTLNNADKLDFVQKINYNHLFSVEKQDTGGSFPAGEIQYCFTYFNKFAQQSAIVDASSLYLLSPREKGLPADGSTDCSFKITIHSSDTNFEYIRIYSILRTSENAAPVVKLLGDFATSAGDVVVYDTGTYGSTVDSSVLLFLNGERLLAETLATKDNTLFVGNLKDANPLLPYFDSDEDAGYYAGDKSLQDNITRLLNAGEMTVQSVYTQGLTTKTQKWVSGKNYYEYTINNNKKSEEAKSFKSGENYRLGFVAQDAYGRWSEVIWLGDHTENLYPERMAIGPSSSIPITYGPQKKYHNVGFSVELPSKIKELLIANNYKRVAPVVVYPSEEDRLVVCQGMLAGTVFNVNDRLDNSPYVQADWRFRKGYSWREIPWEIQLCKEQLCGDTLARPEFPGLYYDLNGSPWTLQEDYFAERFGEYFYRDPSILTLHSPEIEFGDMPELPEDCKLRIVGLSFSDIENSKTMFIQPEVSAYLEAGAGYDPSVSEIKEYSKAIDYGNPRSTYLRTGTKLRSALAYPGFTDVALSRDADTALIETSILEDGIYFDWITYLWHREGSLSNAPSPNTKDLNDPNSTYKAITGALKKHTVAEFNYARTWYFDKSNAQSIQPKNVSIEKPMLYKSSTNNPLVKIPYKGEEVLYYGDIDKVLVPNFYEGSDEYDDDQIVGAFKSSLDSSDIDSTISVNVKVSGKEEGYPVEAYKAYVDGNKFPSIITPPTPEFAWAAWIHSKPLPGREPVHMKYRTTPHAIFALKGTDNNKYAHFGESFFDTTDTSNLFGKFYWINNNSKSAEFDGISQGYYNTYNYTIKDAVYVAELYREFDDNRMNARFGGNSQMALALNDWKMCGPAVNLDVNRAAIIRFVEGDTYITRYDCLKAYPVTNDDKNGVVSVYSTELETRVNLDARYDNNRGLKDNTMIRPENFNLVSRPTYEQTRQFFTYHALDYPRYNSLSYPNTIAWSLEKTIGEDVDTWTNIKTMATFDLDGDKGGITALKNYRNEIFAFQDKGISQILYNSRVQIPVSDGQPIEISNGMKVSGRRYIADNVGVQNKWSIQVSPYALYFIDDNSRSIYRFTDSLENLSLKKGMRTWMESNGTKNVVWNPEDFNNIRTFYDKVHGDVYFTTKDESLVFSEQADEFTSFMSYGMYSVMENVEDKFFAVPYFEESGTSGLWEMWKGNYNMFPDPATGLTTYEPFSLTFIANDNSTYDKVFNNLEWESAEWDADGNLKPLVTFNKLEVWNRYQNTGEKILNYLQKGLSILKKKFNIFRVQIPRADASKSYDGTARQRIRGTWAKFKLSKEYTVEDETDRFELYSMFNDYFM